MSAKEALVRAADGESTLVPSALWERAAGLWTGTTILALGRLGVVLAAAFAFFGTNFPAALLVASVFFVCLQRSSAANHEVFGPAAAAVAGAVTGLLVTLLISYSSTAPRLGAPALFDIALGVCLLVPPVEHLLRKHVVGRRRVLIVGSAESGAYLSDELRRERTPAFDVVDVLDQHAGAETIAKAVVMRQPDIVVFAQGGSANGEADTVGLADFFELALGRVPPRQVTPDWFTNLPSLRRRSPSGFSKRSFDIVVALLAVLLTAPLWPAVAILAATSRGTMFFHQLRVGEGGQPFTMYKFRTMRHDAEPHGQALWALASDPRVRFGGRFLRGSHLDELPQLWNVLKGDMSIVGPRPERPELVPMLEEAIPHWSRRQLVRPGMTGWAQVRQGYSGDCDGSEEKLSYDLWYIRHRTVLLDLAICLWTLPSLVARALKSGPTGRARPCRTGDD